MRFNHGLPCYLKRTEHATDFVYNGIMSFLHSLFSSQPTEQVTQVRFDLIKASYVYNDGNTGLQPTQITIDPHDNNVAIIGLNGSGKTTLLQILAAQVAPSTGSVLVSAHGTQYNTKSRAARRSIQKFIGWADQHKCESFFSHGGSIQETLVQYLRKHHMSPNDAYARVGRLFQQYDLTNFARTPLHALDQEQLHLLRIVTALINNPGILIIDEPTRGLDEISTSHVAKRLFSFDKQIIFSTHDIDLIMCDDFNIGRVLVMDDATIAFSGSAEQAREFYTHLIRNKYRELASHVHSQ